jgi:Kef-type K+ transport system membrane component KefB
VLLAAGLAWVARRLRLPSLLGFLTAGVLVSPATPRLHITHSELELAAVAHIVNSRRRTTNPATERALEDWAAIEDLTGVALTAIALVVVGFEGRPGTLAIGRLALHALIAAAAAWALPRVLRAFRSEADLLVLLSVGGSLTLAGLGAAVFRLPLPLAAFLGGAVTGESPEMGTVREQIRPFRELSPPSSSWRCPPWSIPPGCPVRWAGSRSSCSRSRSARWRSSPAWHG